MNRDSGLRNIGIDDVTESLDLGSMRRTCTSGVEPLGQDIEPFHVTGTLEWHWHSLHDARTATTEEDLLTELLGKDDVRRVRTERPWIRVDVTVRATTLWGKEVAMPGPSTWAAWAREAFARLESIESIVPPETVREGRGGRLVRCSKSRLHSQRAHHSSARATRSALSSSASFAVERLPT